MDTYQLIPTTRPNTAVPAENFSLNFEEIKVTYSQADPHKDKWIDILSW